MKRDGLPIRMPPNPMPHVVERLMEIGLTEVAGMGVGPISWRSIADWQQSTGIELSRWEARLLRQLSVEYVAEQHRAESETCPPPWRAEVTQREREIGEQQLRMVLG